MFKAQTETDKFGSTQVRFILTQGDTAVLWSTPKKDGEVINQDLIDKCMLKFSTSDNNKEIFAKEFEKREGYYAIRLESWESEKLPLERLIYEVEYTFKDGTVNTPNRYYWTITDQIIL